ncbi:WW domain-containing adapter protein with coiled-coil-like [Neofelis nebulosa]|uniref:WW domain-containing adapter protein with coiled-coil-like n=1 Tax=Neofelis nebulosa TaxID=61452 RepID=UPI00272D25E6|nr:WW domain-containing adapter protein with coiled-coil-like [Neofelis nebulosa]
MKKKSSNWKELTEPKGASQVSEEEEGKGKLSCHNQRGTGSLPYQALKCSSKSHPMNRDERHEKMQDTENHSPSNKTLQRPDSLENKYSDSTGHSNAKNVHIHRVQERDSGTNYSPQDNSHNHSALHSSNHILLIQVIIQAKLKMHLMILKITSLSILALLRKNMTTIFKQKFHRGKTKEWLEIKKRQKEAKKIEINSFPKGRDYRREMMQANSH